MNPELIARINELANKKKEEGLTKEEQQEQHQLRQEYLKIFREGFKQKLDNIDFLKEFGICNKTFSEGDLEKIKKDDRIMRIEKKEKKYMITYKFQEITKEEILKLIQNFDK